jgi:hypothetical protein
LQYNREYADKQKQQDFSNAFDLHQQAQEDAQIRRNIEAMDQETQMQHFQHLEKDMSTPGAIADDEWPKAFAAYNALAEKVGVPVFASLDSMRKAAQEKAQVEQYKQTATLADSIAKAGFSEPETRLLFQKFGIPVPEAAAPRPVSPYLQPGPNLSGALAPSTASGSASTLGDIFRPPPSVAAAEVRAGSVPVIEAGKNTRQDKAITSKEKIARNSLAETKRFHDAEIEYRKDMADIARGRYGLAVAKAGGGGTATGGSRASRSGGGATTAAPRPAKPLTTAQKSALTTKILRYQRQADEDAAFLSSGKTAHGQGLTDATRKFYQDDLTRSRHAADTFTQFRDGAPAQGGHRTAGKRGRHSGPRLSQALTQSVQRAKAQGYTVDHISALRPNWNRRAIEAAYNGE